MKSLSDNNHEPAIDIGAHCSTPYECEFKHYCWKGIPAYSIYNIKDTESMVKILEHLYKIIR